MNFKKMGVLAVFVGITFSGEAFARKNIKSNEDLKNHRLITRKAIRRPNITQQNSPNLSQHSEVAVEHKKANSFRGLRVKRLKHNSSVGKEAVSTRKSTRRGMHRKAPITQKVSENLSVETKKTSTNQPVEKVADRNEPPLFLSNGIREYQKSNEGLSKSIREYQESNDGLNKSISELTDKLQRQRDALSKITQTIENGPALSDSVVAISKLNQELNDLNKELGNPVMQQKLLERFNNLDENEKAELQKLLDVLQDLNK